MLCYNVGDNKCQGCTYAIQLPILFMCLHLAGSKKIIFIRRSWRGRMKIMCLLYTVNTSTNYNTSICST